MAKTIKLGPFLGVNNRLRAHELVTPKDGAYLKSAVNVNVSPTGRLERRAGYTLSTALTSGDSLWCDGVNMYYRDNGYLYRDGVSLTAVSGRVSYDSYPGGGVIFTDTASLKYISAAGAVSRLAPGTPAAPTLGTTTGALQPATYLVAITAVDANYVEGGASTFVAKTLATTGGVSVTLPALPAGGTEFRIYVTGPNGEVPTLHGSTSGASYNISAYATNRALKTADLQPMPAGDIVRVHNGRALIAAGNALYISEGYNFGLYDPTVGYILFPDTIALVEPAEHGVYVATDSYTYWIAGDDIRSGEFIAALVYGAIPGSAGLLETTGALLWMTPKGLVSGDNQGRVQNLQENSLALNDAGTRSAVLPLPDEGRIIASTNG